MLTGLELTFMGVIRSNSGLFSTLRFYCLSCGKKRKGGKTETGRMEKGNRKGKEGRKKEYRKFRGKIKRILTKMKTKK